MKKYLLIVMAAAGLMVGCSKIDLDDVMGTSIGTGLAAPIGTIDFTIFDIYSKFDSLSELQFDADNTIFLYWESPITIDQFDIKDFTKGQKLVASYNLADNPVISAAFALLPSYITSIPLPEGTYLITDTLQYAFNFNEVTDTSAYYIDSLIIRQARLLLDLEMTGITLDEGTYLEAELSFPTLESAKPITVNALATTNHLSITRNINSFLARFGNEGDNSIEMDVAIKLVSDGSKSVTREAAVRLETGFEEIQYRIIHGYIYQSTPICSNHTSITLPNTEMLSEFLSKNYVSLYNPEFSITLTTNLGVDALLKVDEIYAMSESGKKNAIFRGGEKWFTETIRTPQTPGDTATTTVTLDRNFGQINELFKEVPDSMVIDWSLYIGNEGSEHTNFILDPIQLDAQFSVRIPVWFDKGTLIGLEDTLQADLTGINGEWTDYVNMKSFQVYLDFANTLPVHANARIAFLDSLGNELHVKEQVDIPCPPVDEYGRSKDIAEHEEVIDFPHEALENIMKTKKIAILLQLDGYDEESTINFHATDGIRVKVSAYANMIVTPSKKQ